MGKRIGWSTYLYIMPMKAIGAAQNRTKFIVKIPPRTLPNNKEEDAFMVLSNFFKLCFKEQADDMLFSALFPKDSL